MIQLCKLVSFATGLILAFYRNDHELLQMTKSSDAESFPLFFQIHKAWKTNVQLELSWQVILLYAESDCKTIKRRYLVKDVSVQ